MCLARQTDRSIYVLHGKMIIHKHACTFHTQPGQLQHGDAEENPPPRAVIPSTSSLAECLLGCVENTERAREKGD